MESYLLNVWGKEKGNLLQERTVSSNRPVSIRNTSTGPTGIQNLDFSRVTVDVSGSLVAAADTKGKIFIFDLRNDKFHVACRLDRACLSLAFSSKRDLVVATSDCMLHFIDFVACHVKKSTEAHKSCVNHISVNCDNSKAATSAAEDVIIWDLSTFTPLHKLANKKSVDIIKAFFLPMKDCLLSAFRNNTVFLWNSSSLKCIGHFSCSIVDPLPWLRSVDGSHDGNLLICSGKVNWVSVWSVFPCRLLHNVSFRASLTSVRQISFLSPELLDNKNYNVVAVLSSDGDLFICDICKAETIYTLPDNGNIVSFSEGNGLLSVITTRHTIDIYALQLLFEKKQKEDFQDFSALRFKTSPPFKKQSEKSLQCICGDGASVSEVKIVKFSEKFHHKDKLLQKCTEAVKNTKLKFLLHSSGEYPEKYRSFIWSQLLFLPRNDEFVLLREKADTLSWNYFPIQNKTVEKACSRVLSMLHSWCPVLKEVDYIPEMIFPFVKLLHKNLQMCFELLVTFICNWCQNWFLYLPFEPYNILCTVENLLLFHDRPLLHHFLMHEITPEIYGFYLVKTAFSRAFLDSQWLKLWDHILTNPPGFLLYLVAAFAVASREVLLQCVTEDEVKAVYSRSSSLASKIIQSAYDMQQITPSWCDPSNIFEEFRPIPNGGYPVFLKFTTAVCDLQTLNRQKAIDNELDHLLRSEAFSPSTQKVLVNLTELKRLRKLQRDLIMQCVDPKYQEHMSSLEDKLKRIQKLMQSIIMNRIS